MFAAPPCAAADSVPAKPWVVGYFAEWSIYQRKYNVADIPADKLTHINYAFAKIVDGECALADSYAAIDKAYPEDKEGQGILRGNFKQLQVLKEKHPDVRTLISVGGWTQSAPFSDVAATEQSRAKFAKSSVAFMVKYGFDGVDIDWEYPVSGGEEGNKTRKEDRANYTLLLTALRQELDTQGKKDKRDYLLTIAGPAGPKIMENFELDKIHKVLDWINIMAYDFHGGWDNVSALHAPLFASSTDSAEDEVTRKQFNADAAVQGYLKAGVPADKIVVGVPFYGRGWVVVKNAKNGLYQKKDGPLPRGTYEAGVFEYNELAANYIGKYQRFWHEEAKAPWLYDEKSRVMITYDDAESLRIKAEYIKKQKLGGVMCWELSGDDRKATLMTSLWEVLGDIKPKKR
jgi:chitinase